MTAKKAIKRFQGWLAEGYHKINKQTTDWRGDKEALELAIQCMNDMRPKGEWKLDSVGVYCSKCEKHPDYSSNFCPNCGADMRGKE